MLQLLHSEFHGATWPMEMRRAGHNGAFLFQTKLTTKSLWACAMGLGNSMGSPSYSLKGIEDALVKSVMENKPYMPAFPRLKSALGSGTVRNASTSWVDEDEELFFPCTGDAEDPDRSLSPLQDES